MALPTLTHDLGASVDGLQWVMDSYTLMFGALLLSCVLGPLTGTASRLFNTYRHVGGALAVAVFGALLAQAPDFMAGIRISLFLAAGVALITATMYMRLQPSDTP